MLLLIELTLGIRFQIRLKFVLALCTLAQLLQEIVALLSELKIVLF